MTCGLTVTRSAGRFCIKKSFWNPVHQLIASKVSFLDEAMLSYFLAVYIVCELAPSHPIFFFSRIRFSFRIFKMRGFVSPAVHHSNAYPAQSCKSATLTRVTTGSQHDFIMPWCKDDTIYQNSRFCIVKFSYSPSQEDTQQIIQLYLLGLKD